MKICADRFTLNDVDTGNVLLHYLPGTESFDLADLARACGYRLEKLPDAVMRWEEISEKDYAAKFEPATKYWSTAAINMGMPEEDFPTGHQWPFPTQQNNADLEEHIARSPEKDAAEYRVSIRKAIAMGPL